MNDFSVFDHGLGNGMAMERKCTDVCFLLLFVLFIGAFLTVSVIGFMHGHIQMLIYPYDGENNYCGYHHKNHPYLYLTNLNVQANQATSYLEQFSVCVESCPKTSTSKLTYIPTAKVPAGASNAIVPSSSDKWGVCKPTQYNNLSASQKTGYDLIFGKPNP